MANDRPEQSDPESKRLERHTGGSQAGGGPGPSDMAAPGGSSGTGGYGQAQNQQFHQGQQESGTPRQGSDGGSRGQRFDEAQGGGRGPEQVTQNDEDAFASDQVEHQDRGQSIAESETEGR